MSDTEEDSGDDGDGDGGDAGDDDSDTTVASVEAEVDVEEFVEKGAAEAKAGGKARGERARAREGQWAVEVVGVVAAEEGSLLSVGDTRWTPAKPGGDGRGWRGPRAGGEDGRGGRAPGSHFVPSHCAVPPRTPPSLRHARRHTVIDEAIAEQSSEIYVLYI